MRCSMNGIPSLDSYANVLKHFNSVKPWRSKYNYNNERPIGTRSVKTCGGRFNKAMRKLEDGSIAFRLFDTDCVIWHPDGTLTIQGHPTVSTSAFISYLTPMGISHTFQRGAGDYPVLFLAPVVECVIPADKRWNQVEYRYNGLDYSQGEVVQCNYSVTLHYSARRWRPVEPDSLQQFFVPTINRKRGREVSRRYNLPTLAKIVNAIMALGNLPAPAPTWAPSSYRLSDIMEHLECGEYGSAVALFPRSDGPRSSWHTGPFGRPIPPKGALESGFLRKLRDHIYEHEGVIEIVEQQSLTPSAYRKYVADSKRF